MPSVHLFFRLIAAGRNSALNGVKRPNLQHPTCDDEIDSSLLMTCAYHLGEGIPGSQAVPRGLRSEADGTARGCGREPLHNKCEMPPSLGEKGNPLGRVSWSEIISADRETSQKGDSPTSGGMSSENS